MFLALSFLFLSVILGWVLISKLNVFIFKEKIFLGSVLGLFLVTTLIFLGVCFLPNFKLVVFLSLLVMTLILIIKLWQSLNSFQILRKIEFLVSWKKIKHSFLRSHQLFLVFFVLVFGFLSFLFFLLLDFQCLKISNGDFFTGGANFGDLPMHLAYIMSFVYGNNFPPQNPFFAGYPLVYQFLPDFLSAILISLDLSWQLSLILPSLAFFVIFCLLSFWVGSLIFDKESGFLATLIFLFGPNLGYVYFLKEIYEKKLPFWQSLFFPQNHTTWDYNVRFYSPLANLFVPERSFLPGLILGLTLILMMWRVLKDKKFFQAFNFILIGLLLGILPFWHFHTFLAVGFVYFCWFWLFFKKNKNYLKNWFLLASLTLILLLPAFFWSHSQLKVENFLHFHFFWTKGEENLFWYWFKNGGLVLFFSPLIFCFKKEKRFFLPAFLLFGLGNIVSFQPWEWDNIKIFVFCFWFFSLLYGKFLVEMMKKGWFLKFLSLIFWLMVVAYFPLAYRLETSLVYRLYSHQDLLLARWLVKNTSARSVFAVSPFHNHPVSTLAGRLTFMGYPGFLWVHGIDYQPREKILELIFKGGEKGLQLALINRVDFVVFDKEAKIKYPSGYQFYKNQTNLIYQNESWEVFALNQ